MNAPRYARLSARLLAQESFVDPRPSSERRAETLAVISRALRAKTRRRALSVRGAGVAAVALALLLGYVCVRKPSRATRAAESHVVSAVLELSGNGAEIVGPAGTPTPLGLRPGGRLLAGPGGGATVQLSTGTRMAIEHDTSLEFENAGPAGSSTFVRPGESWPAHCGAALPVATPTEQRVVAHRVASTTRAAAAHGASLPRSLAPAVSESTEAVGLEGSGQEHASSIALQNELFSEAIVARRLGDTAAAVSSFELFVARYPESPLAESAAVHRLRLLQRLDPVAARSAARSYLARYPSGYAKHDAEQLIAQP